MRYYDIQVLDSSGAQVKHWTSHPNGNQQPPDGGALKVEIDAFNAGQQTGGVPLPGSFVRVWGISLDDIGQASNLNGKDLVLKGGMGVGLPLANANQAGVLVQGHIQQAFANWIGNTMTLDMLLVAGSVAAGTGAAQNFVVNWPKGQQLSTTLKSLFSTLFPTAKLNINISDSLVQAYNELHFVGTWAQLSDYLIEQSRRLMNTGPALAAQWNTPANALSRYPGVQVHLDGDTINVFDGTTPQSPRQITIYDLVGQPTWIGPQTIQITCVMRGDIKVGDFVTLPKTRAVVTAASLSPYSQQRQDLIFNGTFLITRVHHVGNYKDPGPLGWVTAFDAIVQTQTNAQGQASLQDQTTPPQAATPVGGTATVTVDDITLTPPTNSAVGLLAQIPPQTTAPAAPSTAFSQPVLATGGALTAAPSAGDVGLLQSAPAPSLGQSISLQ